MSQPKNVSESSVVMPVRMMPTDANPAGNVHGGIILRQIDIVGGIVASRHARTLVVTSSIDRMDFLEPVYVGEVLILKASVNYVGRSSMEVGIRVEAENLLSAAVRHVGSAYMTFVSVDQNKRPIPLPPLLVETPEQQRRQQEAVERREMRTALRRRHAPKK